MKQKGKKMQRVIHVIMCILLLGCISGCGGKKTEAEKTAINTETEKPEAEEEEEIPTTYVPLASGGLGRYMEEELASFSQYNRGLQVTKEGVWVLGDKQAVLRKNDSDKFEPVDYPQIIRETYWSKAAVSDEGDMVFVCFEQDDEGTYQYILRAVKKDRTVIEMDRLKKGECVDSMKFGPDGKLYMHRFGGRCGIYRYELQEGEGELIFVTGSTIDDITFLGNLLIAVDEGQMRIYDIETDTRKEQDPVLDAFCKENITGVGAYGGEAYSAYIFDSDEENVLYLVCDKGIFRHVLYGSIMEQVVNGELNTLNPVSVLHGAASWRDKNGNIAFLVDIYPGRLMNYIYDPDAPTVPEVMLHVYSLEESDDLRRIITLFQQTYPECYVKYEVGISGTNAAVVEDRIKQLNTAILSGNGPDILLTDGLNEENYSSKGLLLDLSSLAEGMTGEDALTPNLVEALKQGGKIYSLPAAFCIPMIAGEKEFVESIYDIESLTAAVEAVREENPEGVILTSTLPEAILGVLAQSESGKWVKNGSLDENALRQFLTCGYRLYETETKGATEAKTEQEQTELEESISYISPNMLTRIEQIYYNFNATLIDVMLKGKLTAIGYAGNPIELCWVDQLPENYTFAALKDEQGVGFKPVMKLAVNATSSQQEMAQNFVRLALSAKAGKLDFSSGIPLNMEAAEWAMRDWKHMTWGLGGINEIGEEVDLAAKWPLQNTLGKYQEAIESVDHVIEENPYLMQQVIEIGAKAMREGKTVDEAVEEIKKKVAIYLAE